MIRCHIYKSVRAPDTYVYLARRDDFECLPVGLTRRLGSLEWVMELDLRADRKLARADVGAVMAALESDGFYVQLPPPKASLMDNDRLLR